MAIAFNPFTGNLDLTGTGGGGGTDTIGTPTDGSYAGGLLELTPTTKISDATDQINLILAKLAPAKPPNLSSKTIK